MVRYQWSVVPAVAPPLPLSRRLQPFHPVRSRPTAAQQYGTLLRTFVRSKHLDDIQHLEFRGMYAEELNIERGRFPHFVSTLTIGTNGVLDRREFEHHVPPLMHLYQDRPAAYRTRLSLLAKGGHLHKKPTWTARHVPPVSEFPVVNAVAFPYCVPRNTAMRKRVKDPLLGRGTVADED